MTHSVQFVTAFRELFDGQREFHAEGDGVCAIEAVTDDVVRDHLEGRRRLGVYCVAGRERDRCRWAFADVQGPDWELAAAIARKLEDAHGVAAHVERSKAGGWHVWVFFESWIECWKARATMRMAIGDLGARVDLPIEVYPDRDALPADDAVRGCFAWLPMFGGDVAKGRTCFYSTRGGTPAPIHDWNPARAATNRAMTIDALLDGVGRDTAERPYDRGEDEAHENGAARVDGLHRCATRVLKLGVRDGAVAEWAKRLPIHLRRNGFTLERSRSIVVDWNRSLCVPALDDAVVQAAVDAMYEPANATEGLGCDGEHVLPHCVRSECPVWRFAHLKQDEAKKGPPDPRRINMLNHSIETMQFWFQRGDLFYHASSLDNRRGAMHCMLVLEKNGKTVYRQMVNLDGERSRVAYENKVHECGGVQLGDVAIDLMSISDGIVRKLKEEADKKRDREQRIRDTHVMSKDEEDDVRRWAAARPNILWHMIEFTSRTGMIREKSNRVLVYCVGTSRLMKNPLHGVGKGEPAGGKSFLASGIFKLMPEEDLVEYTRITGASLYYQGEFALQHKIFFVREAPGSEGSEHSLRTYMTEGDLRLSSVDKDESGSMRSIERVVRGPLAFYTTTTQVEINPENETRLLQVNADEEKDTTRAIFDPLAWDAQFGSVEGRAEELRTWRNFQRVLKKGLEVRIPYAQRLIREFPYQNLRARRDFARFLQLIKVCAFLHQFHRRRDQEVDGSDQPKDVIVASVADYAIVKRVVEGSLMRSLHGIKVGQERMVDTIQDLTAIAIQDVHAGRPAPYGLEVFQDDGVNRVWIPSTLIRDRLGKTQRGVRELIKALEEQGVLVVAPKSSPMRVRVAANVVDGSLKLPTVEPSALFEEYPEDKAHDYDPLSAPDFDDIHKFKEE